MVRDMDPIESLKSTGYGPARVLKALGYSLSGLRGAWRREAAFRQEVLAAIVLVPLSLFARVTWLEHALLVASVLLVLTVELVNSSIEAIVDRISMERHPLSGHAKDAGSAAVLVACLIAALLWAAILVPVYWAA
jgi:diacylglycerol kinase (ATP)